MTVAHIVAFTIGLLVGAFVMHCFYSGAEDVEQEG